MEHFTRDECPICLAPLEDSPTMTTFCCRQKMHVACFNDTVAFYESHKRDTPCPLCRTTVSEYVAIDIVSETRGTADETDPPRRDPCATKRRLIYSLGVLGTHASFIAAYKLCHHLLN